MCVEWLWNDTSLYVLVLINDHWDNVHNIIDCIVMVKLLISNVMKMYQN